VDPARLEKLPHNIGTGRTGRDPFRETIHTLNVPGRANSKTSQRLAAMLRRVRVEPGAAVRAGIQG